MFLISSHTLHNVNAQKTLPGTTGPAGGVTGPSSTTATPFLCNGPQCWCYDVADCFNLGASGLCAGNLKEGSTGKEGSCEYKYK
jgi:hypothetical protein